MAGNNSLEFILNVVDYATEPFRRMTQGIGIVAQGFKQLQQRADMLPSSLNGLKNKLAELESEKGLTTSRRRVSELNGEIRRTVTEISRLESLPPPGFLNRLRESSGAISKFGPLIAGAFSITAVTSFGQSVVETTAKYQKMEAVLSTQYQSANKGKEAMEMIAKFAANTPFQVDELTGSFVKLKSQGFEPTKEGLTNLGDIAASMGKPFDQLAEAVLDAQSGEFERLKEFGIKAKQHGNTIEMTFKGQTTTIGKSADAMQKYLLGIGKMPGVAGSMAAISETTGGKISNLTDSVDYLKKGVGEGLKPIIDLVVDKLKSWSDKLQAVGEWMRAHPKEIKFFATTIGIAAIALGAITLGMWLFNAALWANPITWVVGGVIALSAIVAYAITYFDGWGKSTTALWEILKSFANLAVLPYKVLWEQITYFMEIGWLKIKQFFQWIEQKMGNVGIGMQKFLKGDFKGAFDTISKTIDTSASKEIEARQKEHEEKLKGYGKSALLEVKNVKDQWHKVGLTATKDDPIAKMKDKFLPGTPAANSPSKEDKKGGKDKGKEMSSNITAGGSRPTTINLTIQKVIGIGEVKTSNMITTAKQAGQQVVEEVLMAFQSVNGKISTQ